MPVFWEIPFVKPQNERLKTTKNERENLFGLRFCCLFSAWKVVGTTIRFVA